MAKGLEKEKSLTLKTLTKSNVWDLQENDIFRLWEGAEKDTEVHENARRYKDIIRSAFTIEEIKDDSQAQIDILEKQGFKVSQVKFGDNSRVTWALKKRPIFRVTDLTYENIRHITATKLIEVLDRNFGGGWDSLSQSIKDIIENGFDISTTTLPKNRLHKTGGMYDKKVEDGYEVLEIGKGAWVEAIFAKAKPESEKPQKKYDDDEILDGNKDEEDEEEDVEIGDTYNKPDEDDMEIEEPDDDDINEDNYSTMMDLGDNNDDITADSLDDYADD